MSRFAPKSRRGALAIGLTALLCLAVSACGKRGNPQPPAGEESRYSYPLFYPNPESTLEERRAAGGTDTIQATDSEVKAREEEVEATYGSKYKQGEDGYSRTRTRVYGWE